MSPGPRAFGGVTDTAEPLVGEVIGLRTFRVDDCGLLLPLYSNEAWYDGMNTASCTPPTGDVRRTAHTVPADDCECGFYAYGTATSAAHHKQMRYVQAIVGCSGQLVAGTQGVRAEHARIIAVWLNPGAPRWVRGRVASRYPTARIYADLHAMHAEYPLSELACYEPVQTRPLKVRLAQRGGAALGLVMLIVLGLLPFDTLRHTAPLWASWLVITSLAGLLAAWLAVGAHGVGHLAAAFVVGGVLAWLLAPPLGITGWLLRVPLLRGILVASGGYLLTLQPHYFPVVRTPHGRAFCGVRP